MKKNVLKKEFATLLLLLFTLSVVAQNDNKNVITQNRNVPTFNELSVSGIFKVIFTQGEPQSVKIEADENLIDRVVTEVQNGKLELRVKGELHNPGKMNVYITAKNLKAIEMSGATKFTATNKLVTPEFNVELSGVAAVTLIADASNVSCDLSGVTKFDIEGTGNQISANISGTAKLLASKFEIKDAKVDVSGVASATINATKSVSLEASGASNIKYIAHENMNIRNKEVSGVSRISQIKE